MSNKIPPKPMTAASRVTRKRRQEPYAVQPVLPPELMQHNCATRTEAVRLAMTIARRYGLCVQVTREHRDDNGRVVTVSLVAVVDGPPRPAK